MGKRYRPKAFLRVQIRLKTSPNESGKSFHMLHKKGVMMVKKNKF